MPYLTVVVRTFNCADTIGPLLTRLSGLSRPDNWPFELLFVDNNSADGTVSVLESFAATFPAPARVVVEARPGAAYGRVRGLTEAQGDYVAFLDDDNWPQPDWLSQIRDAIARQPDAAAFNGKIKPVTTAPIPDHARPFLQFYAIIDRGDRPFCYNDLSSRVLPPGAGLILRRDRALQTLHASPLRLAGPTAQGVHLKGEDIELLMKMQARGDRIYYWPDLVIEHELSAQRFTPIYLENFLKGVARPRHYHRSLRFPKWLVPGMTLLYGLSDLKKLIMHLLRYRNDLRWRLHLAFLRYLLISPYYTWQILRSGQRIGPDSPGATVRPSSRGACHACEGHASLEPATPQA